MQQHMGGKGSDPDGGVKVVEQFHRTIILPFAIRRYRGNGEWMLAGFSMDMQPTNRVFSSSSRKNARRAMRLIRWQHWLVLKLRNGLMAHIIPYSRPQLHHYYSTIGVPRSPMKKAQNTPCLIHSLSNAPHCGRFGVAEWGHVCDDQWARPIGDNRPYRHLTVN